MSIDCSPFFVAAVPIPIAIGTIGARCAFLVLVSLVSKPMFRNEFSIRFTISQLSLLTNETVGYPLPSLLHIEVEKSLTNNSHPFNY